MKLHFRDRYHSKAALRSPPHITLQAPFTWPKQDYERLEASLSSFVSQHTAIPIKLSGFGAFPPRVIYLAVDHTPELMTLQRDLSQHLAATLDIADPRSRTRPFCPHLTIAFRDLKPAAFRQAWPEFEQRDVQFAFSILLPRYSFPQLTIYPSQIFNLIVGIETTGIGQNPDLGVMQLLRLRTHFGFGVSKGDAIGSNTQNC